MDADNVRSIFIASGEAEAHQIQAFLEASGIPSALRRGTAIRRSFGITLRGMGTVEILVDEADEERARELLAAAEAGALSLQEHDEQGRSSCIRER